MNMKKRIALMLSNFIGNDNMLKCYFNANTRYFNRTLNKYSDSKDILHILRIIDRIGINKKNKNLSKDKHDNIINYHLELTNYILKVHTNKLIEKTYKIRNYKELRNKSIYKISSNR